ncbi:MAG: AmmeMemoRadiSam system protein B [Bryobacterales bacterium]|nr:AmmeMemoRadiSam system protein B [Bryobacterales bacterium]
MDLDFQPSPAPDQPGLLIRDSFHYSDTTLIIPPFLLRFLPYFDGNHTRGELLQEVEKAANRESAIRLEAHLRETLDNAGFLQGPRFQAMREDALRAFRESSVRPASHAGAAYPGEAPALRAYLTENLSAHRNGHGTGRRTPLAVAAPHISFEGGWQSYAAMLSVLEGADPESLFVVMGTSHYGEPDRIGLTAKPFSTPLGVTHAEPALAAALASACPEAVLREDYCHAIDHSVEFHVMLLQYAVRPDVCVLPLLVGAYFEAMRSGGFPDDSPALREVFRSLRAIADEAQRPLVWLLSVDMAHMGRRYGDPFEAAALTGKMTEVEELDRARVAMLGGGNTREFWKDVNQRDAELKWCGSSTLYTFTQVYPEARASLLSYEQWNIDHQSVVSFGTLAFDR